MKSDGIERVMNFLQQTFYVDFFVLLCQIIALTTGLLLLKRKKSHYLMLIYIVSSFILFLSIYYEIGFVRLGIRRRIIIGETENVVFANMEYWIFAYLYTTFLKSNVAKLLLKLSAIPLFFVSMDFICMTYLSNPTETYMLSYSDRITSVELLLFIILCIWYFFELFRKAPEYDLLKSPMFWITVGLFFYSLLLSPFLFIAENLHEGKNKIVTIIYTGHYISFGILFLAITKAFLCRKPLTT